jgi:alanine dehydrogenase
MNSRSPLLLRRRDIASLITLDECIPAVERAFRLYCEDKAGAPGVLSMHTEGGGFHIKAAFTQGHGKFFAAKLNANFVRNRERFGMPTIQGVIVLCDAENGLPLALMDSIEITIQRTAAATAIAATYLARANSHVALICGCGNQSQAQIAALTRVLPISQVFAFDQDDGAARAFASHVIGTYRINAEPVCDLCSAVRQSDVVVTCTSSSQFFLHRDHVSPGTFIAAIGADSPQKQELEPALLAGNKVVADILEQCAAMGDLRCAITQGLMTRTDVYAELGELCAGRKPGRTSDNEITIFDSTGAALQDAAASVLAYEKALQSGLGMMFDFAAS